MSKFALLALIAGATVLGAAPSGAFFGGPSHEGPWCVVYSLGPEASQEKCDLPSFEACYIERAFWGSTAFCHQNPRFLPYWSGPGPQPRQGKARHRHRR